MEKVVCYFMTRNIYQDIVPSLMSLLRNGNVDKVYILAEDTDIGIDLPAKVTVWSVNHMKHLLDPDGPNYGCRWSYMVMMKALLCKIFPQLHRALTLDVDTIVRGDLSPLWEIDLEDYYFAGVREPFWSQRFHRDYVNAGVMMWNLDKMRDGKVDEVLKAMNTRKFTFVEQDCLNELCWDRIKVIDSAYNAGDWTEQVKSEIVIRHYMASKGAWKLEPEVIRYGKMTWEEVRKWADRFSV